MLANAAEKNGVYTFIPAQLAQSLYCIKRAMQLLLGKNSPVRISMPRFG
jgi:hypothetical protein